MSKGRITKGPQFLGKIWVWGPLLLAFVASIFWGDRIAENVSSGSVLPAIPALVCMVLLFLYFRYNYRRNN